ncbi:hypothetical protein ACPCUK_20345 [Streptomyces arboris]|uniref:phosphorylase family protein n=1 Tax=Streptomyces arboris TaxID=2600619 RepID=UPI003C2BA3DA
MTELRVGLIVPLREEFGYVSSVVDLLGDSREQGRVYHSFLVPGTDITGLLTVLHDMGQSNAAIAAQDLTRIFGVPLVALIGTGAALASEVGLGDVVVASEIDSYLHRAKAVGDADHPEGRASRWPGRAGSRPPRCSTTSATSLCAEPAGTSSPAGRGTR